ncbi:MAG: type II toxin-antitoxin system VapC family toxin [Verrucomicrobia bacterium]|nr:type II toxin-antitoxin system VapC family toxin [Verrucomicrobiota bacterium]
MNLVFADTWFYLAILNRADPNHPRAVAASRSERRHRVTTDFVLVEVGDALSKTGNRDVFTRFHYWIQTHSGTTVIPASRQLLEDGLHLYRYRRDKDWPLTDCMSFVVMDDEGISDALTGDRHFEQAGFKALLK